MAPTCALFSQGSDVGAALDEVVGESLGTLLLVTVGLAWAWLAVAIIFARAGLAEAYLVLFLLAGSAVAARGLARKRLDLATCLYLASLTVAVTIIAGSLGGGALYLYIPVVLVTGILAGSVALGAATLASAGLILLIGLAGLRLRAADVLSPVALVLLSGLAAWLSSRRLFTALAWTLTMTHQAQRNEKEARERRAEVRSMLKSLDEAYVRLERTNEALLYAREAAERAYRFKTEFVANVSHELRTPLNLIVGFSEMMALSPESYKGRPLPSEYRGDVMSIYRSARHLSDLINDVLDLSQIEADRLPITRQPTELAEVIHEATGIVRGLAEAKGLRLEIDLPDGLPSLRVDRTRIRQVLLNLLTNATRFTDKGFIRVRARLQDGQVQVTVEDSGRGIAQDKIAHAFEAFSQLEEDRGRQGSGLGLAVSRRFVELHGGNMWIASTLGQGTTVGFALPLPEHGQEVAPTLVRTPAPVRGAGEGLRVVVLHDDVRALSAFQRYVEGYQFILANSPAQLAEAVLGGPVAAIITDVDRPGDWPQVARQVPLPPEVPIVTCPLPSLRREGLSLGAVDCLPKPVTRESLLAALARLSRPPQTLLVVDDDLNLIRLIERMLTASNPALEVLGAADGREALEAMRAQRPDAVLLDLVMPVMDGFALMAAMRRDEPVAGIPVIIMSAHLDEVEETTLHGALRLDHPGGLSVTDMVRSVGALLRVVTRPGAAGPASA